MKGRKKFILQGIVFLFILAICVWIVNQILVPKFFVDNPWPYSATAVGFYEMEEDTVEVLFMGSSHTATFFIPQELYNNYGITSYNLASGQQDFLSTYYWIKEALRYQQPKVIVIETCMLFPYDTTQALNVPEANTRKAFDYMRWSPVKMQAIRDICRIDENQSLLSYYLPNIRYHLRWKELNENDFTLHEILSDGHYELKGYIPLSDMYTVSGEPFDANSTDEVGEMVPVMKEYMDKIVALCKEKGIYLILTTNPTTTHSVQKYNTLSAYAQENDILFLDFNERSLYEALGYNYETDNADYVHGNIDGAIKITNYMGQVLQERYDVGYWEYEQWEETRGWYEDTKKDCALRYITDFGEYLGELGDERYTVFITVKGGVDGNLSDEVMDKINLLGLERDFWENSYDSYCAVISGGRVEEKIGETLYHSGLIRELRTSYEITGAGINSGNYCSVKIDGIEYAKQLQGINIVVYNNMTQKVIDSVCFGTDGSFGAMR